MLRSIAILSAGGLLGTLLGIAVGIFVYPYVFLADVVAAEQVTDRDRRTILATGSFVHVNRSDPIYYGSGKVTVYQDLVHLEDDFASARGRSSTSTSCRRATSPTRPRSVAACSSISAACEPSRAARTTQSRPASTSPRSAAWLSGASSSACMISPATLSFAP